MHVYSKKLKNVDMIAKYMIYYIFLVFANARTNFGKHSLTVNSGFTLLSSVFWRNCWRSGTLSLRGDKAVKQWHLSGVYHFSECQVHSKAIVTPEKNNFKISCCKFCINSLTWMPVIYNKHC